MDRARRAGARRPRLRGVAPAAREAGGRLRLRRAAGLAAWSLALLGPACTHLTTDLHVPVAIEFATATGPSVEEHDTLRLTVRVLDRAGDSLPDAPVQLIVLDTAYLRVDSADQAVIGLRDTTVARVVAVSGSLRSDPLAIRVLAAADTIEPTGAVADTVAAGDSASAPLAVTLLDLHTVLGQPKPLSNRQVTFTLAEPAYAGPDVATAVLSNDSLVQVATTGTGGSASVTVKRKGAGQPDSVVVLARAVRATGGAVPGSPVRFVVRFQ